MRSAWSRAAIGALLLHVVLGLMTPLEDVAPAEPEARTAFWLGGIFGGLVFYVVVPYLFIGLPTLLRPKWRNRTFQTKLVAVLWGLTAAIHVFEVVYGGTDAI